MSVSVHTSDDQFVICRNAAGLSLILNHDTAGYGIEHVHLHGKSIGEPKRGDLFTLAFTGLRPFRRSVRLANLEQATTSQGVALHLSGPVETDFVSMDCSLLIRLHDEVNVIDFILRYRTDHDIAARIEFDFHGPAGKPQWEANLYPWAANSTSLPDHYIDETINRHPVVPISKYQNHLFHYAGIPAALLRSPNRAAACLFGVAMDFEYANPTHDWRGGVNIEMPPGEAPRIVTGIKGGYIHGNVAHEVPMQLVVSANDDRFDQPYELLDAWTKVNRYTAQAVPHPVFKDAGQAVPFMLEKRRNTPFFFDDATYATDAHRVERFGTYPANTGYNIFFDLYLGLRTGDDHWFGRAATQLRWMMRMQIREDGHIANGLYCPVIRKAGKEPGFYQNKEYEIESASLGAYWLVRTLMLMAEHRDDLRLSVLPSLAEVEGLAFRLLEGIKRHQQADGTIAQRVTDGGQYSQAVTPAHTIHAFYAAHKYTGDQRWMDAVEQLEAWTMDHCVEPILFIGAHPDLQAYQYEEGSIQNMARYYLERYEDTGDRHYLKLVTYLHSIAFFFRCPKQLSWVDEPTQGCNSEQTHFPNYAIYSYWAFKMLTMTKAAKASGLFFFADEAKFLVDQSLHAVVTEGDWAGSFVERLSDPWLARRGDPCPDANPYHSELAPEYLYQLMELGYGDD